MVKKMIMYSPPKPKLQTNSISTMYQRQLFITYGTVDSNNDDGTCNVLLKNGFISRIKIPSTTWSSADPITGGINYPPVGSEVKIEFPEGDLNSGYVYPVNLNTRNKGVVDALLGQGNKTILPGGWEYTYDQKTGKATFTNGDKFVLNIDPDAKRILLNDFEDNTFISDVDGILINGNLEVLR